MIAAIIILTCFFVFQAQAGPSCVTTSSFNTTTGEIVYATGSSFAPEQCLVNAAAQQYIFPAEVYYELLGNIILNSPTSATIWDTTFTNETSASFSFKLLSETLLSPTVKYYVINSCSSCSSVVLTSAPATAGSVSPVVVSSSCPYYNASVAGLAYSYDFTFSFPLSVLILNSAIIKLQINSTGVFGDFVSLYALQMTSNSGPVFVDFIADQTCEKRLRTYECTTTPCSNSASHASRSHESHSKSVYSESHHSQSHESQSDSHSLSPSHHSDSHSHKSNSKSQESQSHSRSHSNSINYGQNENCTSPIHTMRLSATFENQTDYFYQYYLNLIDYYNYPNPANKVKPPYSISQAGTNNCSSFDLIQYPQKVTALLNPLYLDIQRVNQETHNVAGIVTTDPQFNISITYIAPSEIISSGYYYTTLPDILGYSYFTSPPFGMNYLQLEGGGAFDPKEMCYVFQQGTIGSGYYRPILSPDQLYGFNGMNCTMADFGFLKDQQKSCHVACCNSTTILDPSTCECVYVTLNCVSDFFQYKNVTNSFALLDVFNEKMYYTGYNNEINIVNISISDGNQYVPLDFIKSKNPNNPVCENPIRPSPAPFVYPQCCSPGYETQFYRYSPSTQAVNTNDSWDWYINAICPLQRMLYTSNEVYDPLVGLSIPVPEGYYVKSVLSLAFSIFITEEHMNYYFAKYNQSTAQQQFADAFPTPAPFNFATSYINPNLYIPTLFYSTQCGERIPACAFGYTLECALWTYQTVLNPSYATYCLKYDEYVHFHSNAITVDLYNATDVGPTLQAGYNYTFNLNLAQSDLVPPSFQGAGNKAYLKSAQNLLFNVAWTDFFPGDRVYIEEMELSLATITPSPNHHIYSVTSEMCLSVSQVEVADCGCIDCANQTSTDKTSSPRLSYITSPIMFDNGVVQTPDDVPGQGGDYNMPAFGKRKLLQFQDPNMVFPTQVSSNLRLFVNETNKIYPYNQSTNPTGTSPYDVISNNNCGVYITVTNCSNSLQVWLSPDQNTDYYAQGRGQTFNNFSCYALVPDNVGLIYPLTPNVYIGAWDESQHFPTGTTINGTFSTNANPLTLYQISITTSTSWQGPTMQFTQPAYGFEIPLVQQGFLEGVYFYCAMNIFTSLYQSKPLFEGKNICMANLTGNGIGVSNQTRLFNTTTYAKDNAQTLFNFHFMATPQCPAYDVCQNDGWFVNQDYSVDMDYLGQRMRFPPEPLFSDNHTTSSAGIIPYNVDMTFQLDNPQVNSLVQQYVSSLPPKQLNLVLFTQGPIEIVNFLDIDIHTTDANCEFINLCQNLLVNSTYNNSDPYINLIKTVSQRVWGDGTKLQTLEKPAETMLDVVGIQVTISSCFNALLDAGYTTSDISIKISYSVDANAYAKFQGLRQLNDVDYSSTYNANANQSALDWDGLARRFYFYGAYMFLLEPSNINLLQRYGLPPNLPNSYALYRPNSACPRMPFTPSNFCGGVCTQVTEINVISPKYNISAKAENHPNSSIYDDLVMNTTAINEFLLSINMTDYYYNKTLLFNNPLLYGHPHPQFPFYNNDYEYIPGQGFIQAPNRFYNSDVCNYYIEKTAHEIAINGSAFAAKQKVSESEGIVINGLMVSYFSVFVSFKTDLLISAMNNLGISIAQPFYPGVFVQYNNDTSEVHIFGTAIGLALPFSANFSSVLVPATFESFSSFQHYNTNPPQQTFPQLKIMFFDMIIPNVTRDMMNGDADLISHATTYLPGPYFSQGLNAAEYASCPGGPGGRCGRDQGYGFKAYQMCNVQALHIDALTDVASMVGVYSILLQNNLVPDFEVAIPYGNLLGSDKNITMRMGNGINEEGILGALPVVSSLYSVGISNYSFMAFYYYELGNPFPQVGTQLGQRFRFALYPCGTSCPNNATHYFDNHPLFSATEFLASTIYHASAKANDYQTFGLANASIAPYSFRYVFFNDSSLIYNSATQNMTGGIVIQSAPNGIQIANVNQQECMNMFEYASGNADAFVYPYLGINNTQQSIGLYMNMRDTLGSVEIFGTVCATAYHYSFGQFYPAYVTTATFGGSTNLPYVNPNIIITPIERTDDSSQLFLDTAALFTSSGFNNQQLIAYTVENQSPSTFAFNHALSFNPIDAPAIPINFKLTNTYPGTDPTTVTLYSQFGASINPTPSSFHSSGMKLVCKDCWNAFDDAMYFNWTNTCNQFDLCTYNMSNFTNPFTYIPDNLDCQIGTKGSTLDLSPISVVQTYFGFQWTLQGLPATVAAKITITVETLRRHPPITFQATSSTINGVNIQNDVTITGLTSGKLITVAPFDGNNVYMVVNMTNIGPVIVTSITIEYSQPVNCVPITLSQSESYSAVHSPSYSVSQTPARNFCCIRDYQFRTFVDPYQPPIYTKSQSHQSQSHQSNSKSHLSASVPLVLHYKDKRRANSHSQSKSTSHQSHSTSPSWQFQYINTCNPSTAPIEPLINGTRYQLRDEFVSSNHPPYYYDYQHLGFRMGALWLQFSSNTAGVNATSIQMDFNPQDDSVRIYGYAWGVWSIPPNRVGLVQQYGLDAYFRDSLWYFDFTYRTGYIVNNSVTRAPVGNGGVTFAVQELDMNTGLPMNVTASLMNTGYIRSMGVSNFTTRIAATNMHQDIYVPSSIDPIINSFKNSTVQMFVMSENGPSRLGQGGWLGIGQMVAFACLNYSIPDWDERYYDDIGNQTDLALFNYFLCLNRIDFDHQENDYYIPKNLTFGLGELLFVVESECAPNSNSESHSPSHYSLSHHSLSHHSKSHESHSRHSASHESKSEARFTNSRSKESHSKSHESHSHHSHSKSHMTRSHSRESKSKSHHSHSHKSKSHSESKSSKQNNHHVKPKQLIPTYALILLVAGVPIVVLVVFFAALCLSSNGARTRGRRNSQTYLQQQQPLLAQHRNPVYTTNNVQPSGYLLPHAQSAYHNPVHTTNNVRPSNNLYQNTIPYHPLPTNNNNNINRVRSPTRKDLPDYKKA
jgi:hypothetical protein